MQRPGLLVAQTPITREVTCGRALAFSPSMICAAVRFGFTLSIRLIAPETSGVEKLVPNSRA